MALTFKQIKKLADAGASIHIHVEKKDAAVVEPPPPDPEDPTPIYIFQKPEGSQQAAVRAVFVKANGNIEPSDIAIVGYVQHNDQVLLLELPENMASTYIPDDWWYVYVVGRSYTGFVRKKEGRDVVEQ